jgi:phospholipase C
MVKQNTSDRDQINGDVNRPADTPSRPISRRDFFKSIAATAGALAVGGLAPTDAQAAGELRAALPAGSASDIEHIVVVMMENRSFDHFLGWLPGADGRQAGLTYLDRDGVARSTYHLADFQGCGHPDPDHSYEGGRVEYNSGACDGWLRAGANDIFAIGYYTAQDLAFLGAAAPYWTSCDRYFAATMAETFPNRFYQHSARTDRIDNALTISTLPTIWDRLAQRKLTGRYYFSDVPFLALWGLKYLPISHPFATFLADCAAGTLPQVSYVDPRFLGEEQGTSGDDHPHSDIRNGEVFLNQVYTAVTTSPAWPKTLLVVNYDEWGGFFDHVPPGAAPDVDPALRRRGFRVPCLLISPWSRRRAVSSTVFDHTSILRLIESRWKLEPLTVRDAEAHNIAKALDFRHPSLEAPGFAVPPGPFGGPCPAAPTSGAAVDEWRGLRDVAPGYGWSV